MFDIVVNLRYVHPMSSLQDIGCTVDKYSPSWNKVQEETGFVFLNPGFVFLEHTRIAGNAFSQCKIVLGMPLRFYN